MKEYVILELELYRFVGMELTGIERFKLVPRKDKMVILGRNGSGKSRLLSVLLGHSLNKLDLMDGGFWKQRALIDGVEYTFKQYRHGKGIRCDVHCGDKEILSGANPTVYNDKITSLLGYDKKTRELLGGLIKLTRMSTPERKHWFSQLATSDLSTALKYFKLLKENLRDTVGGIKVTERYVADLKPMVMESEEEYKQLSQRVVELERDYHIVADQWLKYSKVEKVNIEELLEEAEKWANKSRQISIANLEGSDYYTQLLSELTAELKQLETNILPRYKKEINEVDKQLSELRYYSSDTNKLKIRIDDLNGKLERLDKEEENFFDGTLGEFSTSALSSVLDNLDRYEKELNDLVIEQISTDKLKVLNEKLDAKKTEHQTKLIEMNRCSAFVADMGKMINNHTHTEEEECPECSHRFKPGFKGFNIEESKAQVKNASIKEEALKKEIETISEEIGFLSDAIQRTSRLMDCVQRLYGVNGMAPVIGAMLEDGGINANSTPYKWFKEFRVGLQKTIRKAHINAELENLSKEYMIAMAASGQDMGLLEARLNEVTENVTKTQVKIDRLRDESVAVRKRQQEAQDADIAEERLATLINIIENSSEKQASLLFAEHLGQEKDELWSLLNTAKSRLQTFEETRKELKYNEEKLQQLKERKIVNDELVKEMSPTDGLLAEYLYKSIFAMADSMSLFIENIFEYPLVVKPCDVEEGELDYQFPMVEGESGVTRADVSLGSDAQQEIINATFVMSAMKALRLNHHPAIFDEPGRALDPGHKTRYADFLSEYFNSEMVSQAFVVSHNSEIYTRFGNVDFIVLNPDGVDLPESYNECVEITYG